MTNVKTLSKEITTSKNEVIHYGKEYKILTIKELKEFINSFDDNVSVTIDCDGLCSIIPCFYDKEYNQLVFTF